MTPRFFMHARKVPDEVSGVKIAVGPPKRQFSRWKWRLAIAGLLSPLLYLAFVWAYTWLLTVAPGMVIAKQVEIRATQPGFVERILVNVGDEVRAGQPVAVISDPALDAKERTLAAELGPIIGTPTRGADLGALLAEQVRLRQGILDERLKRLDAVQRLVDAGAATVAELDRAREQRLQAEDALTSAREALVRLRSDIELVGLQRHALTLTALRPGRVTSIEATEGTFVNQTSPIVLIDSLDEVTILAYLEPRLVRRVRRGGPATVRFSDGTTMAAEVSNEPRLSRRLPVQLGGTFSTRRSSVVVQLSPDEPWPERYRIDGLPVTVRFHYPWERTAWGRPLAAVLRWLQPGGD